MSCRARKGWLPSCMTNSVSSLRGSPSRLVSCAVDMARVWLASSAAREQLGGAEEIRDLAQRSVGRIGAVHHVLLDAGREICADGARGSLLRVGGTHDVAITRDGVLTLQHLHDDGTRAHVTHQVLEERTLAMHGIEALGLLLRELQHAGGDDGEATLLESAVDLADQVGLYAVGLDDGQGALERHSL